MSKDKITNKKINFNKKPKHLALIIDQKSKFFMVLIILKVKSYNWKLYVINYTKLLFKSKANFISSV